MESAPGKKFRQNDCGWCTQHPVDKLLLTKAIEKPK